MVSRKDTPDKKENTPPVKRPFSRSRSIDDLLGTLAPTTSGPSELGRAFQHATKVKKVNPPPATAPATDESEAHQPPAESAQTAPTPAPSAVTTADDGDRNGVMLPISSIVENPKLQPRLRIDEEHVISLSEKFAKDGQLSPIIVRPSDEPGEKRYEIIGGNHRYRAAKRLGWSEILCNIRVVSLDRARILAIDDNDSHLPTTDYEKALAYHALLADKVIATQQELAAQFNLSAGRISQCMDFMKLPQSVLDILNDHPDLFSYRTASDLKKLIAAHTKDGKDAPENVIEYVTAGVMRLVDGAPLSGLIPWIEQRIAGKTSFAPAVEPRIVLDRKGRTAFKTKGKPNSVVVEWDKNANYSPEDVQDALMEALRSLAAKEEPTQ